MHLNGFSKKEPRSRQFGWGFTPCLPFECVYLKQSRRSARAIVIERNLLVISEMILTSKWFETQVACVWPFVRMCSDVDQEVIRFGEMTIAVLADVFLRAFLPTIRMALTARSEQSEWFAYRFIPWGLLDGSAGKDRRDNLFRCVSRTGWNAERVEEFLKNHGDANLCVAMFYLFALSIFF